MCLVLLFAVPGCVTVDGGQSPTSTDESSAIQDSLQKAFDAITRSSTKHEGLFTLYQDTLTGSLHMAIAPVQVGREFLYFIHTNGSAPSSVSKMDRSTTTSLKHLLWRIP